MATDTTYPSLRMARQWTVPAGQKGQLLFWKNRFSKTFVEIYWHMSRRLFHLCVILPTSTLTYPLLKSIQIQNVKSPLSTSFLYQTVISALNIEYYVHTKHFDFVFVPNMTRQYPKLEISFLLRTQNNSSKLNMLWKVVVQ